MIMKWCVQWNSVYSRNDLIQCNEGTPFAVGTISHVNGVSFWLVVLG